MTLVYMYSFLFGPFCLSLGDSTLHVHYVTAHILSVFLAVSLADWQVGSGKLG